MQSAPVCSNSLVRYEGGSSARVLFVLSLARVLMVVVMRVVLLYRYVSIGTFLQRLEAAEPAAAGLRPQAEDLRLRHRVRRQNTHDQQPRQCRLDGARGVRG